MRAKARWANATLGALGDWHGGGTPSKGNSAFWAGGTIPWISPKDMKVLRIVDSVDQISESALRSSAAKLVPAGSVLMVVRSGILSHTFPVSVAAIPVALNQDMKALSPKPEVDPFFVCYYLIRSGSTILGSCAKTGTTVPSIETVALKNFPIPIPPLPEQHQIVAAIEMHFSRLDAAVASLTRARASVKRARASVLKAAVEGRLVPTEAALSRADGRDYEPASALLERILADRKTTWTAAGAKGKYKEPAKPDTTSLPDLPEGWVWATVESCADTQVGHAFKSVDFVESGVNLVRGDNIGHGSLRWESRQRCVTAEMAEFHRDVDLRTGDIVLAMDRPIISSGIKLAMVAPSDLPALLVQRVTRLRSRIDLGFLYTILSTRAFSSYLLDEARGGGVPHVSEGQIARYAVPLPPLAEQRRIVAEVDRRLSVLDALEGALAANLARCGRLRQAILKRAFEGRLVPADGADANGSEVVAGDKMYIDLES